MDTFDRFTPAHAAIGLMMVDPDILAYAMQRLTPDDIPDDQLRELFSEIIEKYREQGSFTQADALCLRNRELAAACLRSASEFGGISEARKWVNAIKDQSTAQQVAVIALDMAAPGKSRDDLLEQAAQITTLLQEQDGTGDIVGAAAVAGQWLTAQNNRTDTQIKTGLAPLDYRLHMEKGMFIVEGGRPSAGKTALALQQMLAMAKAGHKCVFFSLETSPELLFERLVSNWAHIPLDDLVHKRRPPNDPELARAADELSRLPFWLVSAAGKSVQWMASVAASKNAEVLFVDYLQLIPQRGTSRYEQVTKTSLQLHTLAQQSKRLVIGLAQLNRETDGTEPTLRNLRESGQIEQDADGIVLLGNGPQGYSFTLAKNKRGIIGKLRIVFDGTYQTFFEVVDL